MRLPKVGGMPFFDRFTVILELGFFGKSRLFSVSRTFGRGIDRVLDAEKSGENVF